MIELEPDRELSSADAETVLGAWLGERVACTTITKLSGGLVNSVYRLEFDAAPHAAVVKLHGSDHASFEREARGLRYLRDQTACPVPDVYAHDSSARLVPHAYLLLEHVEGRCLDGLELSETEQAQLDADLARVLADLHRHAGNGWGPVDELSGRTWPELFTERLVGVRAYPALTDRLPPQWLERVDRLIEAAPDLLGDTASARLVHGDVWAGNTIVRRSDERWEIAALLDPDAQFADPEYELAYLDVFDARREVFFDTYLQHAELRPGYRDRRLIYWLHTALLHVALFDNPFFVDFTGRTVERLEQLV